jgi:hypothetical protein
MRQKFGHTYSVHLAFVASCSRRRGLGKRTAFESSSPDACGETLSWLSVFSSFAKNSTIAPREFAKLHAQIPRGIADDLFICFSRISKTKEARPPGIAQLTPCLILFEAASDKLNGTSSRLCILSRLCLELAHTMVAAEK